MRVLLADDDSSIRSALRLLLEQGLGFAVVGEVAAAGALAGAAGAAGAAGTCADVVLVDWELPDLDAPAQLAALKHAHPGVKVIAVSGRPEAGGASLAAGADAFHYRGDPPDRLLDVLASIGAKGAVAIL